MVLYFPGVEMPKSCGECRCSGTDVCREWMNISKQSAFLEQWPAFMEKWNGKDV